MHQKNLCFLFRKEKMWQVRGDIDGSRCALVNEIIPCWLCEYLAVPNSGRSFSSASVR